MKMGKLYTHGYNLNVSIDITCMLNAALKYSVVPQSILNLWDIIFKYYMNSRHINFFELGLTLQHLTK